MEYIITHTVEILRLLHSSTHFQTKPRWQLTNFVCHIKRIAIPSDCISPLFPFPPEYIQKYATEEALKEQEDGAGDSSSESSMSDFSEDEAQDMEL